MHEVIMLQIKDLVERQIRMEWLVGFETKELEELSDTDLIALLLVLLINKED